MAALPRTINPVMWQERTHQTRSAPRWMRWLYLTGIGVILLLGILMWDLLENTNGYPAMQFALFSIWGIHATVALRCIFAGANAISREHVGQTWDALVLTGVSARQILWGKWRAALDRVGLWMVVLAACRFAILPVQAIGITKVYATFMCGRYNTSYAAYSYAAPCDGLNLGFVPWSVPLAIGMIVVLSVLEVLCCTAIGIAASAIIRRGTLAAVMAITARFIPVAIFAAFTRYEIGTTFWRWWRFAPFALADSGTTPIMQLAMPILPWTDGQHELALPGLFMTTLMLSLIMIFALGATLVAIRSTGALPQAKPATK